MVEWCPKCNNKSVCICPNVRETLSTTDPNCVSCIDKPPSLESHQKRRVEQDELNERHRLELVKQETEQQLESLTTDTLRRNNNQAVEALLQYAAELEPYGTRTMPPPWYKRLYWRWSCKLKEIIKIVKE